MEKFSVLPTDKRFLNLYEEQKFILYMGMNNLPDLKDLKRIVEIENRLNMAKKKSLENFANKNRISVLRDIYTKEGLSDKEIDKKIKEYLSTIKNAEIARLEKEKFKNA